VPSPPAPADTLSFWQRLLGHSLLVDTVLRHQGWQYEWSIDHVRVLPPEQGERQVCPLMQRLAALGVPTLVVAEYDPYYWADGEYAKEVRRITGLVVGCADRAGLATLDMFDAIDAAVRERGLRAIYGDAHPSPAGTAIAARRIAEALRKHQMAAAP
jgi:lysophospholipase L1-like esterase